MADQIIITDDEPKVTKVEKEIVVLKPEEKPKKETVTERTVVRETRDE